MTAPNPHSNAPDTSESPGRRERRLLLAALLTTVTLFAEAVGGVISGSLALLADAGHMLVDASGLILAWLGARFARRPADARRSYGYARLEVLAGFVNALTMIALAGWIVWEAIARIREPAPILSGLMLVVAMVGFGVNLIVLQVLGHGHAHPGAGHGHDHGSPTQDLNVQGARLHVIGDLLGSIAVIAAALVVRYTGWTIADPILSVLVAALILFSAWRLLRRSAHILLEGVPEGIDIARLTSDMTASHGDIRDIHHVHVWMLGSSAPMATLHVRLDDNGDARGAQAAIRALLAERFGIDHVTVQIDPASCPDETCGESTLRP